MKPQVTLFLDANMFLHYRAPDQIDWCSHLQAKEVHLKVAPITTRELNKAKDNNGNSTIGNRARAALKLLNKIPLDAPLEIRKNVYINIEPYSYSDYSRYGLDPYDSDDALLLHVIHHAKANEGMEVGVMARDIGLRVKANHRELLALMPDESWELPQTPDPIQKELQEHRALAAAKPKLSIFFPSRQTFIKSQQPTPPPSDQSTIAQALQRLREAHPFIEPTANPILLLHEHNVREYNREVAEFHRDFESSLKKFLEYLQWYSRVVTIGLELFNEGQKPATAVSVRLSFPEGLKILSIAKPMPQMPSPPPAYAKWTPAIARSNFADVARYVRSSLQSPPAVLKPDLCIKDHLAEISLHKIQHASSERLPKIFVYFDNYNEMPSFDIGVEIVADEIPLTELPSLQVQISKDGGDPILKLLDNLVTANA